MRARGVYLLAKPKNKDHVSRLFESCLQVCQSYFNFQNLNKGGKTRNFSESRSLNREGGLGISKSQSLHREGGDLSVSEFL